jgi:hypothetical protein
MQWSPINWPRLVKLVILGAVAFWLPDVILYALRGYNFSGHDVRMVTMVSPATFLIAIVVAKWADKKSPEKLVVPAMVSGVWLLGGLFMMIGASFAGGGFAKSHSAFDLGMVLFLSVFPPYTFIMATYDGAVGALLLVTAAALALWLVERSGSISRLYAKATRS